jgi:DNA invertase Pin-like site-specific DNA recombinase
MLVGYGRTSTVSQEAGLEAQERDLKAAGVEKLFTRAGLIGSRAGGARGRSGLLPGG